MNRRTLFSAVALAAILTAGGGAVAAGAVAAVAPLPADAVADPVRVAGSTRAADATTPPSAPVAPSPSPADVTPSAPSGLTPISDAPYRPLVAGEPLVTRADLEAASPLDQGDPLREIWITQSQIKVQCMADAGWYFDPRSHGPLPQGDGFAALYGSTGAGDAYRWQDAGCDGRAVHETGQDDAN
jgi:hypothetical protein